jgi:hypothetical protein
LASHPQAIIELDVSPDGKRVATVGFDDQLRVYSVANGRREWSAACPCNDMDATAFSADGSWIAAGGRNGMIRIWDSLSAAIRTGFKPSGLASSIEFTPTVKSSRPAMTAVKITDPSHPEASQRWLGRQTRGQTARRIAGDGGDVQFIWDLLTLASETFGHVGTVSCLDSLDTLLVSGSLIRKFEFGIQASGRRRPEAATRIRIGIRKFKSSDHRRAFEQGTERRVRPTAEIPVREDAKLGFFNRLRIFGSRRAEKQNAQQNQPLRTCRFESLESRRMLDAETD